MEIPVDRCNGVILIYSGKAIVFELVNRGGSVGNQSSKVYVGLRWVHVSGKRLPIHANKIECNTIVWGTLRFDWRGRGEVGRGVRYIPRFVFFLSSRLPRFRYGFSSHTPPRRHAPFTSMTGPLTIAACWYLTSFNISRGG